MMYKIFFILIFMYLSYSLHQRLNDDLENKDLAIKSLVDYYEDEDRRLLLEANELLRLRKEIK